MARETPPPSWQMSLKFPYFLLKTSLSIITMTSSYLTVLIHILSMTSSICNPCHKHKTAWCPGPRRVCRPYPEQPWGGGKDLSGKNWFLKFYKIGTRIMTQDPIIFLLMFVFRMQCAFANLLQNWLLSSGEVHWRRVKQRGLWQWGGGRPGSRCIFFYCKQWTMSCHPKTSLLRACILIMISLSIWYCWCPAQVRRGRRKVSLVRRLSTRSEWSAWEERPASPWYRRWQWLEESDKKCWSIVVDNWEVVFYFASSYLSSSQWQQSGENLKYDRGDNLWTVSETISQMAASHSRHNFEQHPPTVDNFNCKKRQMWG